MSLSWPPRPSSSPRPRGQPPSGRPSAPLSPRRWPSSRPSISRTSARSPSASSGRARAISAPTARPSSSRPCPTCPHRSSSTPKPNQYEYQIFTADLAPDAKPSDGQHGQGRLHLLVLPPRRQVDPLRLDPPEPQPLERPRHRPTRGRAAATAGASPRAWTSSRPTSTARTWSA